MASRSQRPQNPPPPGEGPYATYAPPNAVPAPALAPPVPSTSTTTTTTTKPPALSLEQSRHVARTHHDALKQWLEREGALATATATRTNARDKLTRLTRQQFQELSTDVYDELVRRIDDSQGRPGDQPFLAVRPDFHPKRNQARQKLATLPLQRFKDLASDVYFELDRRYPEFAAAAAADHPDRAPSRSDSLSSSSHQHHPTPPANLNAQRRAPTPNAASSPTNEVVVPNKSTMVVEEPSGNFTTQPPLPSAQQQQQQQQQRQSPPAAALSPTTSSSSSSHLPHHHPSLHHQEPQRSSPTTEQFRGRTVDELSPLQNQQPSFPSGGPFKGYAAGGGGGQHHQSRASEVSSVGTHSKFFGGYAGSATGPPSEAGTTRRSNELPPWDHDERQALEKQQADYEYKLTVLQNRVHELERENEDAAAALRGRTAQDDGRVRDLEAQVRRHDARYDDQTAQLRLVQRDFDALQLRHEQAERERREHEHSATRAAAAGGGKGTGGGDAASAEDVANELRGEVSSLVDELRQVNERCEELQVELDQARRDKEDQAREAREWKDKWQAAKTELRNLKATSQLFTSTINVERDFMPASPDGLVNDTSVASFQTSIDDLLDAARSKAPSSIIAHARRVVAAVELIDRDVHAIAPYRFDQLAAEDQDVVHSLKAKINATLSNLMTASKNHATSFGVSPVSLLDAAASHLAATIVELVRILKIRKTTPGSGSGGAPASSARSPRDPMPPLPEDPRASLTTTTKSNGYVSGGVSSLVSSSTAGMRNALEAIGIASSSTASRSSFDKDRESLPDPPPSAPPRPPPPPPQDEPVSSPQSDYGAQQQQQQQRYDSFSHSQNSYGGRPSHEDERFNQYRHDGYDDPRREQQQQYDDTSFSRGGDQEYGSPSMRAHETNVDELRAYIENQTEAIVHSIQSLLSAIRSGSQGEQLNENLTQIITIVSSIVAISKDALPTPSSRDHDHGQEDDDDAARARAREGEAILADLTDHCDKLSEMQSSETGGPGQAFTKQTKQAMATASFGVAKSLKQLNGLFATVTTTMSSSSSDHPPHPHRYQGEGLV
ncbi:hypothetical protein JCM11491_003528 [Sporobolomyces phaffii]